MSEYQSFFADVRKRREMYVGSSSYDALAAFFMGFNESNEGGLLAGFQQWLVVKSDDYENIHWQVLVLHLAFPELDSPDQWIARAREAEQVACMKLFDLFEEYLQHRHERGIKQIFLDHQAWEEQL